MTRRATPRLLAALTCAVTLLVAEGPAQAGWLAGWENRQAITIQPTITPGNLTDFPLLVQIKSPANEVFAKAASPSGRDIVFTAADGTTVLPREIEHYSSGAAKELDAWVRTDLSATAPTTLYMYYGGGSLANSPATWDNGFRMVQHLEEDPSGTGRAIKDSTAYGNDGTTAGGMASGQQVGPSLAKIGGALDFDGNDYINHGNDASLYPADITLEAWARADTFGSWNGVMTNGGYWSPSGPRYGVNLQMGTAQYIASLICNGTGSTYAKTASAPNVDQWYHIALTHDAATNTNQLYVDGEAAVAPANPLGTLTYAIAHASPPLNTVTGAFYASGSIPFKGIIDEVRISDVPRDADWLKASYNNQSAPAAHQAEGAPEAQPLGWLEGYTYRQPITLAQGAVPQTAGGDDTTLVDFPVPIQLRGANHLFDHVHSPGGYDITFTDATGQARLDCEFEVFDKAGDQLTAWVKVPHLPSNQDTTLYMYYGGPAAGDPSTTATWDANFTLVQHLEDDPSAAGPNQITDSSQYGNHGTPNGVMASGQQVGGMVGGALVFDGNDTINCGNDPSLNPLEITLEAWARADQLDSAAWFGIVTNKANAPNGANLEMGKKEKIAALVGDGTGYTYVDNGLVPDAERWYHIALAHDGTANYLYVDGELVKMETRGLSYSTSFTNTLLGAFYSDGALRFDGILDEIRMSDIARSGEWIIAGYHFQHWPTYGDYVTFGGVQTPEPTTLSLLGLGAIALVRRRRRRG